MAYLEELHTRYLMALLTGCNRISDVDETSSFFFSLFLKFYPVNLVSKLLPAPPHPRPQ